MSKACSPRGQRIRSLSGLHKSGPQPKNHSELVLQRGTSSYGQITSREECIHRGFNVQSLKPPFRPGAARNAMRQASRDG